MTAFRDSLALQWDHHAARFQQTKLSQLSWSVNDFGTLFGAILVERFRTYGGRLLDLSDHRNRLLYGAKTLNIETTEFEARLESECQQLIEFNKELVEAAGDVSVVLLLSPGEFTADRSVGSRPTCMMHLSPLPFPNLACWYEFGVDLSLGSHRSVPGDCWPVQMKSRSRLPYLLSDSELQRNRAGRIALLLTTRGTIADTSVANVLVVNAANEIISPPKEDILVGCTLRAVERLLAESHRTIEYRDVYPEELGEAREVILTGSSGGVWSACSVDQNALPHSHRGRTVSMLTKMWTEHVGIDFVRQSIEKASASSS